MFVNSGADVRSPLSHTRTDFRASVQFSGFENQCDVCFWDGVTGHTLFTTRVYQDYGPFGHVACCTIPKATEAVILTRSSQWLKQHSKQRFEVLRSPNNITYSINIGSCSISTSKYFSRAVRISTVVAPFELKFDA